MLTRDFEGLKVSYHTLGCKLNFAETSTISRGMQSEGFEKVEFGTASDVCVINTCSVTQAADKETKQIIKRALKANSETFIVVTGCYAQLKPEEIAQMNGVDLVLGASEKFNITAYLSDLTKKDLGDVHSCEIADVNQFVGSYSIGDRTRAFLKVQDGCDYKCTYCTIPQARGISRSDSVENVLSKANEIAEKGIKEIVLTGVNTGDYGKGEFGNKKHDHTFLDLIQALDGVSGIERIRISSIEPNLLTDEIIDFVAQSDRFVPHFHIPLQSGNNEILGLMKRRYQRELYQEKVARIKSVMPNACIGVDVIVGFPGETESHFLDTYNFINELDISYLHVFTYSERSNTEALELEGVVPIPERKRRNKMLRILSTKKRQAFYVSQLNSDHSVLFEDDNKDGFIEGYSENYVRVRLAYNLDLVNSIRNIAFQEIDPKGIMMGLEELVIA